MKHIFYAALFVVIVLQVNAQAPASFNYQGIVRNNAGAPLASQAIAIQASILQDTATGAVIYTEVQHVTTSSTGYFTIQIGKGAATAGSFAQINWSDGRNKWLQISVDATGGSNYKLIGSSQLVSVPYALHAGDSGPAGSHYGDLLYWDGTKWKILPEGKGGQVLTMTQQEDFSDDGTNSYVPTWVGRSYPIVKTIAPTSVTSSSAITGVHLINAGINTGDSSMVEGIYISKTPIPLSTFFAPYNTSYVNGNKTYYRVYNKNYINATQAPKDTLYPVMYLTASTTYYARAFAWNNSVIAAQLTSVWGNQVTFTTAPAAVPTLTTKIAGITKASVTGIGNVVDNGGADITSRGFVIGTSPNPDTLHALKFADGIADTGAYKDNLAGLTGNTKYYARAYAVNSAGVGYGPTVSFSTNNLSYAPGQLYGGGVVFYVDPSGLHGLVASLSDQSESAYWGAVNINSNFASDSAQAIGTGAANTAYIISVRSPDPNAAPNICTAYRGGGYSDWFLPSADELLALYVNRNLAGGFDNAAGAGYWSSSMANQFNARYILFTGIGIKRIEQINDGTTHRVRAVRAF